MILIVGASCMAFFFPCYRLKFRNLVHDTAQDTYIIKAKITVEHPSADGNISLFRSKKRLGKIILSWITLHSTTPKQKSPRSYCKAICLQTQASSWRLQNICHQNGLLYLNRSNNKNLNTKVSQPKCARVRNQPCRNLGPRRLLWNYSMIFKDGFGWLFP